MSQYNTLKAEIDANINQNGEQAITGAILNSVLNAMVNTLGAGYQFAGVATTETDPGTPDAKVFYIANGKGTYTNFGDLQVTEDDVVILYWDSAWHKISTGIVSKEKLSELEGKVVNLDGKEDVLSQSISSGNRLSLFYDNIIKNGMTLLWDATLSSLSELRVYPYIGDSQQPALYPPKGVETALSLPSGTTKLLLFTPTLSADSTISIKIAFKGKFVEFEDEINEQLAESKEELEVLIENKVSKDEIFDKSINIYDGKKVVGWILSVTGVVDSSRTTYRTTDLIPIEKGNTYYMSGYDLTINGRRGFGTYFCEFDADKNPIIRASVLNSSKYEATDDNVKYIRWSYNPSSFGYTDADADVKLMIYKGGVEAQMVTPASNTQYTMYEAEYSPMGTIDKLPFMSARKGKHYVAFGDSITDFGFYPQFAGKITGMVAHNMGFGGCRLTETSNANYNPFSMCDLADAIVSGDFSSQHSAAQALSKSDWDAKISELESMDFSEVQTITIAYGTNDFMTSSPSVEIGSDADENKTTIKGAVNYIVKKLQTAFPKLQIIFITPLYRRAGTNNETDTDTWTNANGYKMMDFVNAIDSVADNNHVEHLDMYYSLGVNKYNWQTYLIDGTHPTYDGYRLIGRKVGLYIMTH